MKALVKAESRPGLWLQDVPEPRIEADEVLIKVLRTGLCGTDLHIQNWDPWAQKNVPVPMVTGHEFCGEVVEIGAGVRDVAVGDVVSGEGHLVCGRCRNCRAGRRHLCIKTRGLGVHVPGAFAEYVAAAVDERLGAPGPGRPGRGRDLRPVRQRGPHGAVVPGRRARTC